MVTSPISWEYAKDADANNAIRETGETFMAFSGGLLTSERWNRGNSNG